MSVCAEVAGRSDEEFGPGGGSAGILVLIGEDDPMPFARWRFPERWARPFRRNLRSFWRLVALSEEERRFVALIESAAARVGADVLRARDEADLDDRVGETLLDPPYHWYRCAATQGLPGNIARSTRRQVNPSRRAVRIVRPALEFQTQTPFRDAAHRALVESDLASCDVDLEITLGWVADGEKTTVTVRATVRPLGKQPQGAFGGTTYRWTQKTSPPNGEE